MACFTSSRRSHSRVSLATAGLPHLDSSFPPSCVARPDGQLHLVSSFHRRTVPPSSFLLHASLAQQQVAISSLHSDTSMEKPPHPSVCLIHYRPHPLVSHSISWFVHLSSSSLANRWLVHPPRSHLVRCSPTLVPFGSSPPFLLRPHSCPWPNCRSPPSHRCIVMPRRRSRRTHASAAARLIRYHVRSYPRTILVRSPIVGLFTLVHALVPSSFANRWLVHARYHTVPIAVVTVHARLVRIVGSLFSPYLRVPHLP
jgi:hypothetical protein